MHRSHTSRSMKAGLALFCALLSATVAFGERRAEAAEPASLEPVNFVPVYWDNTLAEVQNAVLEPFYSDFTHQWKSNGFTEVLAEYNNAGKTMTYTGAYNLSNLHRLTSGTSVSGGDLYLILFLGIFGSPPYLIPSVLPSAGCSTPPAGQTDSYSHNLYVMHLPPGVTSNPCAYHSQLTATLGPAGHTYTCHVPYAVVSDVSPGNGNGCDTRTSVATQLPNINPGMINQYTVVLSHELVESMVDPWADKPREIGDTCQNLGIQWTNMQADSGPPWFVMSPWSAKQSTCQQNIPATWDSEAYKSSGFAVARGPYHMDVFSVLQGEVGSIFATRPWDRTFTNFSQPVLMWQGGKTWLDSPSGNTAPAGAPVAAIASTQNSVAAYVAGNDGLIHTATCENGDGCQTSGNWDAIRPFGASNGSYQVAPGAPISAVADGIGVPLALFFPDVNGRVLEIASTFLSTPLTVLAPAGTVSPHAYVNAVVRFNPTTKLPELNAFAARLDGTIGWYHTDSAGTHSDVVPGSNVAPGTQIAVTSRVPGSLDIFAADNSGAVQSYWWEIINGSWHTVSPAIMPPGTTVRGAGVAVAARADHMDVFTTTNSGNFGGISMRSFDELIGWGGISDVLDNQLFCTGAPLQAISRFRDAIDVFGMCPDGEVRWGQFTAGRWDTGFNGNMLPD